ncbi:hypothetical protein WJX81_000297 [Elliptochloris bilobata]|uniref:CCR4-Not complex component Not N-terminal domain-containing protein n=1 Tax=Elliptochloris bilobata TaxID=381761 RepID=A0AAW1RD50_9CHLO
MERFKDLEKEIKLKPFAKAALSVHAREKVDPAALAKAEAQAWLRRAVATLAEQKERVEADLEELAAGGRGGKRPARALELEARERRHTLHIARVEQVLRLLENDQARPAQGYNNSA